MAANTRAGDGPGRLPQRRGVRPTTTSTKPHTQLDQQPVNREQHERLAQAVFALPGVEERASQISVPGARALCLADGAGAPADAFMVGTEFAHLHPRDDQSLHVMLPPALVAEAIDTGWAELHPVARRGGIPGNAVMLYAPRDDEECAVVARLVTAAYQYATGSAAGVGDPSEV